MKRPKFIKTSTAKTGMGDYYGSAIKQKVATGTSRINGSSKGLSKQAPKSLA